MKNVKSRIKIKNFTFWIFVFSFSFLIFNFAHASAQSEVFNVDASYDWQSRDKITATIRHDGANAHWYISDTYWAGLTHAQKTNLLADLEDLADEFDRVIYPKLRAVFGFESKPGVDGDPKIYILLSRMIEDAGGYFREQNGFSKNFVSISNEREMIYLNISYIGNSRVKSFLAHEFQHLITFNHKTVKHRLSEEIWLNELRSEIAPTLLGYDNAFEGSNLEARVKKFLENPVDSILNWQNESKDYAAVNLLGQYILDHYGRSVVATMIANNRIGIDSINAALRTFGFRESFTDIFTNWTIASLINDCSLGKFYCYKNPRLDYDALHITFSGVDAEGTTIKGNRSALDWEANWFEFRKNLEVERPDNHIFSLDFSSPLNSGFRVPYVIYEENALIAKQIKEMVLRRGEGEFFVEDFGFKVPRIVIMPSNQYGVTGSVGEGAPEFSYDFTAELIGEIPETEIDSAAILDGDDDEEEKLSLPDLPNGTLIRAANDYKVYIIKGGPSTGSGQAYKRWVQSSEIFNFYGHFNFLARSESALGGDAVKIVAPEQLALYKDSWLVRAAGDKKVYEINGDGTRHWLDISAEKFSQTGRLWNMVYVINQSELEWYQEGASVK